MRIRSSGFKVLNGVSKGLGLGEHANNFGEVVIDCPEDDKIQIYNTDLGENKVKFYRLNNKVLRIYRLNNKVLRIAYEKNNYDTISVTKA